MDNRAKCDGKTDDSKCKASITIRAEGTVRGPSSLNTSNSQDGWMVFKNIDQLTVLGGGTFDGQGRLAWKNNNCAKTGVCNLLAVFIFHSKSLENYRNMDLKNIAIDASIMSLNTDGIHIGQSNRVSKIGVDMNTGDDCISQGDGSQHINIENVTCSLGHGISIGSLCKYRGEQLVVGITYSIFIRVRSFKLPTRPKKCKEFLHKNVPSSVRISDILFKGIHGISAKEMAMQLTCSKSMPCQNVTLRGIGLKYARIHQNAVSQCSTVKSSIIGIITPPAFLLYPIFHGAIFDYNAMDNGAKCDDKTDNTLGEMHPNPLGLVVIPARNCVLGPVEFAGPCKAAVTIRAQHIQLRRWMDSFAEHINIRDDCISLGDGRQHIYIENITCFLGHGINIGCLGKYRDEQLTVGVTVRNCTITNTANGVRVKTWPNLYKGMAYGLHFEDIIMNNVSIINQNYCPSNLCKSSVSTLYLFEFVHLSYKLGHRNAKSIYIGTLCKNHGNAKNISKKILSENRSFGDPLTIIVRMNDVLLKDIQGTSTTEMAIQLTCSKSVPCQNVKLRDTGLKYLGMDKNVNIAILQCSNVRPSIMGRITNLAYLTS
ncbi:hypothetical protein Cgig2_014215 [Carnegiea gigantea]|uniref:Polygalacturonase n=1 Tax=Carnegiea gigantea TaxID=171969 RepID=A0A9Q1GZE8_9CARY|nr:hypothetical protein Cgig2_014215 [Carnegiea gigantea]